MPGSLQLPGCIDAASQHRHATAMSFLRKSQAEISPSWPGSTSAPRRKGWVLLLLVVGGIVVSVVLLGALWWYFADVAPEESVFNRMRAAVTALGVITIGAGAVIAFRRQITLEHQLDLDRVKEDRSGLSELHARYQQAAGQLGDKRAMIRIAGVYALEALADEWADLGNQAQRDVCIDLLCGYLRSATEYLAEGQGDSIYVTLNRDDADVRRTITTVIARHLHDSGHRTGTGSWSDHNYDLTDATFAPETDFTFAVFERPLKLSRAHFLGRVTFSFAKFIEGATFDKSNFIGRADFPDTVFSKRVTFCDAMFSGAASFERAFIDSVDFSRASAEGDLNMHEAVVATWARFSWMRFDGKSYFSEAEFRGNVKFDATTFTSEAAFFGSTFLGEAEFDGAVFDKDVSFFRSSFKGVADLSAATFKESAIFSRVAFSGWATFDGSSFHAAAEFDGATFEGSVPLQGAGIHEEFLTDRLRGLGAAALVS